MKRQLFVYAGLFSLLISRPYSSVTAQNIDETPVRQLIALKDEYQRRADSCRLELLELLDTFTIKTNRNTLLYKTIVDGLAGDWNTPAVVDLFITNIDSSISYMYQSDYNIEQIFFYQLFKTELASFRAINRFFV